MSLLQLSHDHGSHFHTYIPLCPQVMSLLIPAEESDMSDLVLEVTAGVGGQEAMLFTAEVFDMYQGYAAFQGWGFDILDYSTSEIGGYQVHFLFQ